MSRTSALTLTVSMLLAAPSLSGQMAHRLKGSIRTTANVPLANATIRADAVTGFRGEPFAGAKEQSTTSQASGEWNITNLEAGLWMFSSTAPEMLPAVIVIPVKFSQRQQVSAIGNALTWQLPMWATPVNQHQILEFAADLIAAGKMEEGMQSLTVALGPDIPDDTRVAAGELALLVRNPALAKMLFGQVLQQQPKHPRATLGAASAALMGLEWENAGKIVWDARDLAPKELRQALAAAIDDLRAIARVQ
jgi:hypothetical protein